MTGCVAEADSTDEDDIDVSRELRILPAVSNTQYELRPNQIDIVIVLSLYRERVTLHTLGAAVSLMIFAGSTLRR